MKAKHTLTLAILVTCLGSYGYSDQASGGFLASDFERVSTDLKSHTKNLPSSVVLLDDLPADAPVPVSGKQFFTPWKGVEVEKVAVIENGIRVEKYWKELSPDVWRSELQNNFVQTEIIDKKTGKEFSLPTGIGFSAKKGEFQLSYYNFRYKTYPCSVNKPNVGALLVGVGVRIEVDAKFKNGSFSLGFTELALSASKNRVTGTIQADQVGLGNANTLSQVVGATQGQITYEGLIEASKAYAVANQALEYMVDLSNPQVFGLIDNIEPGKCQEAFLSN